MIVFYREKLICYAYDGETFYNSKEYIKGWSLWVNYEKSKEGLKAFYKDLVIMGDEIEQLAEPYIKKFNPCNFTNLDSFIYTLVKRKSKIKISKKNEPIDEEEQKIIQMCNSGGLIYHIDKEKEYKNVSCRDFSNYYLNLTANPTFKSKIPIKRGEFKTFETLPKKLPFGMYNVEIVSNHKDIKKCFTFSKDNYYTHTDLKTALFLQTKGLIESIKLIQKKDNVYIYKDEDLITINKIFSNYYNTVKNWREQAPHNKLIKMLGSQLYSRLNKTSSITYKKLNEDISNYILLGITYKKGERVYKLKKTTAPTSNSLRMYPWIASYGRHRMFDKVILKSKFSNILRIYIDSVIFKKPPKSKFSEDFKIEDKYNNKNIKIENKKVIILN